MSSTLKHRAPSNKSGPCRALLRAEGRCRSCVRGAGDRALQARLLAPALRPAAPADPAGEVWRLFGWSVAAGSPRLPCPAPSGAHWCGCKVTAPCVSAQTRGSGVPEGRAARPRAVPRPRLRCVCAAVPWPAGPRLSASLPGRFHRKKTTRAENTVLVLRPLSSVIEHQNAKPWAGGAGKESLRDVGAKQKARSAPEPEPEPEPHYRGQALVSLVGKGGLWRPPGTRTRPLVWSKRCYLCGASAECRPLSRHWNRISVV